MLGFSYNLITKWCIVVPFCSHLSVIQLPLLQVNVALIHALECTCAVFAHFDNHM